MNKTFRIVLLFLITVALASCKEAYIPPVDDAKVSYLVVEGMLNNGGLTTIHLSRTRPLNEDLEKAELKAAVSIQDDGNQSYTLTEQGFGNYTIQLSLDKAKKYRLRIKTSNGKEYLSDFVAVLSSPPVDKVYWEKTDKGLDIFIDSHDPANNTRYYRWGIEESWTRVLGVSTEYEYINKTFRARAVPGNRICYIHSNSEPLVIASTVKLNEDVVSKELVNQIPLGSSKIADKYSILVKQYALDKDSYEYWLAMRKNTETLGSIFDPQPSYMYGNIRSVSDPKELVVGYFGACNVAEKRIFITAQETKWYYLSDCDLIEVPPAEFELRFGAQKWIPVTPKPFTDLFFAVKSMACADCGSNTVKPGWWP